MLPPSIMMVICYMIISANLKMFKALDSNRRQAAAVEEVVRTVGETSIAVPARPNKADAPRARARWLIDRRWSAPSPPLERAAHPPCVPRSPAPDDG